MSNVVNRTTKQYLTSVNTPDYPVIDWIINPDMSAVVGFESKYWIITGDLVTLMDQAARDQVDVDEAAALVLEFRSENVAEPDNNSRVGMRTRALIELLNKRDNYLTNRIAELQNTLIALQSAPGNAATRLDNLPTNYLVTNTRTRPEAIQDYKDDINAGVSDG